jgi:hypothetical protein
VPVALISTITSPAFGLVKVDLHDLQRLGLFYCDRGAVFIACSSS